MARLELNGVCARYGATVAVDGVSLTLAAGGIGCLVGPSGCGKTSLLRAIAGFEPIDNGSILLGERVASAPCWALAPQKRAVGMLFQDFALFPHRTVAGNIAFGLRGWSRTGRCGNSAKSWNSAPRPQLLLLDEPFSSQDSDRRAQLAQQVRHILRREHVTALLVTHDQHEAFAIADTIGVMDRGQLHQWDDPYRIYHRPADRFVADFIGHGALLSARVRDGGELETALGLCRGELPDHLGSGDAVSVLVRPDDVVYDATSERRASVVHRTFRGADFLYTLALDDGEHVLCLTPSHHDHPIGTRIGIRLALEHLVVFERDDSAAAVAKT
jgi:iron(III) transport system ATP-binding protein